MYLLKNLDRFQKSFNHLFLTGFSDEIGGSLIKTNVIENDESYDIEFIVPGFKREELSVTIEGKNLVVEGKKEGKEIKYNKSIYFPNGVKTITAKLENGILTVSIPKEKTKKDKIVVDIK